MKRIYTFLIVTTLCALQGMAQINQFFEKYANSPEVTSVSISKTMISMISKSSDFGKGDLDFRKIADRIDNIRIISTESPKMAETLKKDAAKLSTKGYEELINVNDKGENTVIYMNAASNGVNSYLILNNEKAEFNAILITGKINPTDIREMVDK